MAGRITFSARLEGGEKVQQRFKTISDALVDCRPLLKRTASEVIYPEMRSIFLAGGKPKWTPLAASTLKRKTTKFILIETRKLMRSLISNTSPNSIYRLSSHRLEIGSKLKTKGDKYYLGSLHQEGTSKMPKREIFSKTTIKKIFDGMLKIGLQIVQKAERK